MWINSNIVESRKKTLQPGEPANNSNFQDEHKQFRIHSLWTIFQDSMFSLSRFLCASYFHFNKYVPFYFHYLLVVVVCWTLNMVIIGIVHILFRICLRRPNEAWAIFTVIFLLQHEKRKRKLNVFDAVMRQLQWPSNMKMPCKISLCWGTFISISASYSVIAQLDWKILCTYMFVCVFACVWCLAEESYQREELKNENKTNSSQYICVSKCCRKRNKTNKPFRFFCYTKQ